MSSSSARMSMKARRASDSRAAQLLARAGLTARGVIYILIGIVAFLVAIGQGGHQADQQGALQLVASQPFGLVALWLLAIGFVGYALWRFSEAAFGVPGEGNGAGPRLKSLVRGLVYAFFAVLTFKVITGKKSNQAGQEQDFTASVMHHTGGRFARRDRRADHRDRRPGAGGRGSPAQVHEAPADRGDERADPEDGEAARHGRDHRARDWCSRWPACW